MGHEAEIHVELVCTKQLKNKYSRISWYKICKNLLLHVLNGLKKSACYDCIYSQHRKGTPNSISYMIIWIFNMVESIQFFMSAIKI